MRISDNHIFMNKFQGFSDVECSQYHVFGLEKQVELLVNLIIEINKGGKL